MNYFSDYLIVINLVSFIMMFLDKRNAQKHKWRIPERRLFLYALLFGGIGIWFGMYILRHKTKHKKFVIGIPAIMAVQFTIIYFLNLNK